MKGASVEWLNRRRTWCFLQNKRRNKLRNFCFNKFEDKLLNMKFYYLLFRKIID